MTAIDTVIVLLFLIGVLIFGTLYKKFVKTSEDYFLARKVLPWWAIGMSVVVADIGATEYIGMAGGTYRFGLAQANFDWIGCIPAMIISAIVFVPYYWKAGLFTVPEYLGRRYNVYVRAIEAVLWVVFLAFALGIILWATALVLNTLLGWDLWVSIIVTAVVAGIYTIAGGLAAVVMTNALQLIIMFIGGATILILGFIEVGGWEGMTAKVLALGPEFKNHMDIFLPADSATPYGWPGIILGLMFVLGPAYWIGNQAIVQSALGARNEWDAKAGMLWGAFLKLFIPLLIAVPGLIALSIFPGLSDGDTAFPMLIREILPPGLTGLVMSAFLAALLSTVASFLESASTLFTKDVYQCFIKKNATDSHYLYVGRIVTFSALIIGIISAPLSRQFPGIFVAVQTLLTVFQGPTFAILLLGMFWKRATGWGGLSGLLGGVFAAAMLFIFKKYFFSIADPFLYVAFLSFIISLVITITVSLFTEREPEEKMKGLIYSRIS